MNSLDELGGWPALLTELLERRIGLKRDIGPRKEEDVTRNGYLIASLAAAGAVWATRRWGFPARAMATLRRANGRNPSERGATSRGEIIYRNTPAATGSEVAHLGVAGNI